MTTILPPNQFDSGARHVPPTPDEAAVPDPQMPSAGAAADIPADKQRYPFGCPDPEWCRGISCYWHCNEPDDISNIGEIFAGARKLEPVEMWFENTAYPREDELLYEVLSAMDNPHAPDLIEMPYGMEGIFDPAPLFLRQTG